MCNCEDRPCCGCGLEEASQEAQHEMWLESQDGDFAGVVQDEEDDGGDLGVEDDIDGEWTDFDDFETHQQCEDAYLDSAFEDRYESDTGDFED